MKKKCSYEDHKSTIGKVWHFLAHEDSWESFLVDAILVILIGKFLIFPILGAALGTPFPIVAVVSGSMDHQGLDFDNWWEQNAEWYEDHDITKEQFQNYYRSNGFKKGDVFIVKGSNYEELEVGDTIVYNIPSKGDPIIHRVISTDPLQTKGDANADQINFEENISEEQYRGKAVAWMPYIGWVKVIFLDLINLFR